MTYNETLLQNITGFYQLTKNVDTATGNVFLGGFMLVLFIVMVMSLKRFSFPKAFLSSAFVCFILSTILMYIDLLSAAYPIGFLIVAALTIGYMVTVDTN